MIEQINLENYCSDKPKEAIDNLCKLTIAFSEKLNEVVTFINNLQEKEEMINWYEEIESEVFNDLVMKQ